jgi:hypothetical protein
MVNIEKVTGKKKNMSELGIYTLYCKAFILPNQGKGTAY